MPKYATLTEAYAFFGAEVRNPRWSWSAVSPDKKTVVVTLWNDETADDGSVDFFGHPKLELWKNRIGNKFRIEDLQTAEANCNGEFRVVRVRAKDTTAKVRAIADRYPDKDAVMKLQCLDPVTGEFSAIQIR